MVKQLRQRIVCEQVPRQGQRSEDLARGEVSRVRNVIGLVHGSPGEAPNLLWIVETIHQVQAGESGSLGNSRSPAMKR
jgi:hypothetical protein